ncbi:Erf4 domain-containing protein [Trichostrongylus colubriformis]|uniref:Ras modification protein ERF4 n=1 Tax=Trichostrongylus colubriformis TaxID=6319 RepID=A0AAN8FM39_TRICO
MVMASPPQSLWDKGVTVHEMKTIRLESCRKIFVPRDYTFGLNVHFETQFPMAFRGKISEATWENTIQTINSIFADAEKICFASVLETVLGCATCYCSRLVSDTIYQKKMKKLNGFLNQENLQTYNPAGFHILSPMERGLRTIEIWILSDQSSDIATSNSNHSEA